MEPPSNSNISILNESGKRLRFVSLRHALYKALERHGRESAPVAVLLTGDEQIRSLNSRFRGIDEATDVLSFPAGDFPLAPLGDIAISIPYAERQARLRKVSLEQEIAFLAIHGALHLLGFEDDTDADREAMVKEMNEVAIGAGLEPDLEWHSLLHHGGMD
jgi:probable rRNA maturation factor